jgi:hypothetical protein
MNDVDACLLAVTGVPDPPGPGPYSPEGLTGRIQKSGQLLGM